MAKLVLNNISSGYASATALDANFTAIEAALENTLSRDGTSPNTMSADLDLNGNGILNVGSLMVGGVDITALADDAVAAAASAAAALVSETNAAASEVAAETAASEVVGWEYAGTWTNNTPYLKNNIVYSSTLGDGYICITSHTSNAAGTISDDIANWGLLALHAVATGGGDMYLADNLAGLANYPTARANMGLTIGSHVQAYDPTLLALAGVLTAANKIPYATALNTAGELDFKDEDNMASNSATALPSQQSVKAYVDTEIAAIPGGIGDSQTWQNLTASRALNTTYTNTTGKPIAVSIQTTNTGAAQAILTVDGVAIYGENPGTATPGFIMTVAAIVPAGATYIASNTNQTLNHWRELTA